MVQNKMLEELQLSQFEGQGTWRGSKAQTKTQNTREA